MQDYAKIIKSNIDPLTFLENNGVVVSKKTGAWRGGGLCPFHDDTKKGSFFVSDTGGFMCFSCGERGGDIIAFHMLLNNVDFIVACKEIMHDYNLAIEKETYIPVTKGLIGQSHSKGALNRLASMTACIAIATTENTVLMSDIDLLYYTCASIDTPYNDVKSNLSALLRNTYNSGGNITPKNTALELFRLYKNMLNEKLPLEIFAGVEVNLAHQLIAFLSDSHGNKYINQTGRTVRLNSGEAFESHDVAWVFDNEIINLLPPCTGTLYIVSQRCKHYAIGRGDLVSLPVRGKGVIYENDGDVYSVPKFI